MAVVLTVNGKAAHTQAPPHTPLFWPIRGEPKLSRTRLACDTGMCGASMAHVDGDWEGWAPTASSANGLNHIRLRRVLDYIAANIDDDVTLASLARIAGYSLFHFARKFTLAIGVPPHRYISGMRLERAKAELAAGKLPLVEIALNAHFSSQASFTRAFHRATGITPKEYQRRRLQLTR